MKHHPTKPVSATKPTQKRSPPLHETGRHQKPSKPEVGRVQHTPEGTIEESHEEQAP
ncbi:hypothetical protein [Bdellovibrio bacteriovorus]|uniref:hypothetical protein n=1 Tax=Bdellovibrio bacteriovorus TaxID=959 RepID=UPI0002FCDEF0|nr:hypothetical protein [Bdellovibrio bacteriovorus]